MKQIAIFIITLLVILFTIAINITAQSVVWTQNYGGQYNESGQAGLQTPDGGFLIAGNTYSDGTSQYDIYLIKLDSAGDTLWTRTYGGEFSDYGYDIIAANNNEYIITGSTRSYGAGNRDLYLLKVDSSGNEIWSKTYGGIEDDEGRSITATSDGNFVICGSTSSSGAGYNDLYLLKINALGDSLWSRAYGGSGGESGYGLCESSDSGIVAIGATGTFGEGYSSIYIVKTDINGDSLWADAYGGSGTDFGYSVKATVDNGFIFVGATTSYGAGYSDAYVFKTDSLGWVEWEQTYGGVYEDRGTDLVRAADGTYLLTGSTRSYGSGDMDIFLVKLAPTGEAIWSEAYGGSDADQGCMVFQDNSFKYIVVGESKSYTNGGSDLYLMKISSDVTPVNEYADELLPSGFELKQNYPNPFNMSTRIEYLLPERTAVNITIYNILGQTITEFDFDSRPAGAHSLEWDGRDAYGADVATGIYFFAIRTESFYDSKKMVLIK